MHSEYNARNQAIIDYSALRSYSKPSFFNSTERTFSENVKNDWLTCGLRAVTECFIGKSWRCCYCLDSIAIWWEITHLNITWDPTWFILHSYQRRIVSIVVKIHLSVNRNESASPLPTETWHWFSKDTMRGIIAHLIITTGKYRIQQWIQRERGK